MIFFFFILAVTTQYRGWVCPPEGYVWESPGRTPSPGGKIPGPTEGGHRYSGKTTGK